MPIIKTSALAGASLDYAVGYALYEVTNHIERYRFLNDEGDHVGSVWVGEKRTFTTLFSPSTNWSQLGPMIEEFKIDLFYYEELEVDGVKGPMWEAMLPCQSFTAADAYEPIGATAAVAACRAIVAAKIGEEVYIPEELL